MLNSTGPMLNAEMCPPTRVVATCSCGETGAVVAIEVEEKFT
jgi:hypothetical protein